jgi:hypothetical protein
MLLFILKVLCFRLRAYTLSHSTNQPFSVMVLFQDGVSKTILHRLASNRNPPDLCLLSS